METAEPNMCPDGTFSSWTGSANSADCQEIVSSEEELAEFEEEFDN